MPAEAPNPVYETRFNRTEQTPDFSEPAAQQAELRKSFELAQAQMQQAGILKPVSQVAQEGQQTKD